MNPKADDILCHKAYKSVTGVPGEVDVAVFAIPAEFGGDRGERRAARHFVALFLHPPGRPHNRRIAPNPCPLGDQVA